MPDITFGDSVITIDDVVAIAKQQSKAVLNRKKPYIKKIEKGAEFLKTTLANDDVIYGVTTGYGDSCTKIIPKNLHNQLPLHLTRFHGCGLGDYFDAETTRAIIAVRLCSLARGYSGVTFELLEYLELLLEHDILPLIPEEGSVGASGDLTPLSYIARTLTGEQKAIYKNKTLLSAEIFKKLDIKTLQLKPKEGLALMNGTAVMTAVACLNYRRAVYLAKLCSRLTAMISIAMDGNHFHFDELLFKAKPHAGQMQVAKWIRDDIGAKTKTPKQSSRLQDQYSLRCAPHIIGVLMDALPLFESMITTEINSANDNPIVDPENERIMHGGHFYGGHIAFVMDSMKNTVANLADMMDRQIASLVDEKFNKGLPANLVKSAKGEENINHGFKAVQIGVSAWTAEALKNTMPASVFSRSTECHNQDKVSMGTIAARDCTRVLELTEQVAAALMLATAQALSLRFDGDAGVKKNLSAPLYKMYQEIRKDFDLLTTDRPLEETLRLFISNIQAEKWRLYD
jgi:histidine ammonia-lyase